MSMLLAIVAAAVANMALGALWYSPVLFATAWMAEVGITVDQVEAHQSDARRGYLVSTAGSVVAAAALALLAELTGANTALAGATVGLITGVGLVATAQASHYSFESRSLRHYLINTGYPVVSLTLMGAIVAALG